MTWTKLSDDYSDDCWTLSDTAFRLHTEGLIWSNRKLLDLRLGKDEVRRWAKHPEAAGELVANGYWVDRGDHYVIRHHGGYQWTRERVLNQQAANRANRARGKARPVRPTDDSSDGSSDERDGTGRDRTGATIPTPETDESLNGEVPAATQAGAP
jgi:hypothetical protein